MAKLKEQELSLTPTELLQLLKVAIPNHGKVLIGGPPATAKTAVAKQAAAELEFETIVDHFVTRKPTDFTGIPWIDPKTMMASYHPIGKLAQVLAATKPTLWLMDDIGHGKEAVQAAAMTPLLDREIEGRKLPDVVSVVGTTNRAIDKTGAHALLETVKSRFDTIVTMNITESNVGRWFIDFERNWLSQDNLASEPLAFLKLRTDLLYKYDPTSALINFPNLRTWESIGKWMHWGLPSQLNLKVFVGAVGEGAGIEFDKFVKTIGRLPDIEEILKNPKKAPIPGRADITVLYAVVNGLAAMSTMENFENVLIYADRMNDAGLGSFASLLVKSATKRKKVLYSTKAFINMINNTELGKIIRDTSAA